MNEMKNQPEALRLAELIRLSGALPGSVSDAAASELRRLHAENQELKEQMAAIGAGGVEPLRKRAASAALAAHDERQAFEKWLRIKPCGAAHDFGWEAWKARVALSATHPAAQGLDARDAAFEAVRKAFCKLQRYSFFLDGAGNVRRCADHCGNWVEFDAVHTLFEPQSVEAALAAQAKNGDTQS